MKDFGPNIILFIFNLIKLYHIFLKKHVNIIANNMLLHYLLSSIIKRTCIYGAAFVFIRLYHTIV